VALSGDGGDELFAGYTRYWNVDFASRFDRFPPLRACLASPLWRFLPSSDQQKSVWRKARRFGEALGMAPARRYLEWVANFDERLRRDLFRDEYYRTLATQPADFLAAAWNRAQGRDAVTCASLADLTTYLVGDIMTKVDIASMAHGLECRAPLLDYRVVEFVAGLSIRLKYRAGRGKYLLQRAFGELLPSTVFTRPKMGFSVPLDRWFRSELQAFTSDLLLSSSTRCAEFLRPDAIRRLWDVHQDQRFDHSARLWALVMLELWLREWA
jgi:asparagine synthase (glutamine-hydrolysing)